jgi:hypothetical protein
MCCYRHSEKIISLRYLSGMAKKADSLPAALRNEFFENL